MATKRHSKPDGIWLFDYTELEAMDDCVEHLVWLSWRDIQLITTGLKNANRFRSRVHISVSGDIYTLATPEQFEEFQGWISDLFNNLGGYQLCNELMQGILDQLTRLADRECCQPSIGGGSSGAGLGEGTPTTQTSTPEARAGDPPAGFASWEEYDPYKCDMAHYILNQMISDVATAGLLAAGYTGAIALATALVAGFLTPIGWAVMIGLAGLAIQWFVLGAEISFLTSFLEDRKDDFVCDLLDGDSVAGSISAFGLGVDERIPEDASISALGSIAEYLAIQYIKAFATIDSFNRLYNKVAYEIPTGLDCSACIDVAYTVTIGTETSEPAGNANPIVITYDVAGYACAGDFHLSVVFSEAVTITNITTADTTGTCGGYYIHQYFDQPDINVAAFLSTNGRPQDTAPVEGVIAFFSLVTSAGTPSMQITYTV